MKQIVRGALRRHLGLDLVRWKPPATTHQVRPTSAAEVFDADGMTTIHNHDFLEDPQFVKSYARAVRASGIDFNCPWRVLTVQWAGKHASQVGGDFVECGAGYGFYSSALLSSLPWNAMGRTLTLIDTFAGVDERHLLETETNAGIGNKSKEWVQSGFYNSKREAVVANFDEWDRVRVIQGSVPDILPEVDVAKVAYLHLDMNCAKPEVEALNHFWPKMAPGGVVLFDDYAYYGFRPQYEAITAWAISRNLKVLALPTGQGMLLKPVVEEPLQ